MIHTVQKNCDILLLHAYGQTAFNSGDIIAYGGLDRLMASDILADVPKREKSLAQLWEAAQMASKAETSDNPGAKDPEEDSDAERG